LKKGERFDQPGSQIPPTRKKVTLEKILGWHLNLALNAPRGETIKPLVFTARDDGGEEKRLGGK